MTKGLGCYSRVWYSGPTGPTLRQCLRLSMMSTKMKFFSYSRSLHKGYTEKESQIGSLYIGSTSNHTTSISSSTWNLSPNPESRRYFCFHFVFKWPKSLYLWSMLLASLKHLHQKYSLNTWVAIKSSPNWHSMSLQLFAALSCLMQIFL